MISLAAVGECPKRDVGHGFGLAAELSLGAWLRLQPRFRSIAFYSIQSGPRPAEH
jgi:hypothetical protein